MYKFFEVKNGNTKQCEMPTIIFLECVLMPNGEIINNGKTIKYIEQKDKALIESKE